VKKIILFITCIACTCQLQAQQEENGEAYRLLRAKKYKEALEAFARHIDTIDYKDNLATFNAAICATRVGDHAAAGKYFTLSIENNYNLLTSYIGKANALKEQARFDEMVATLKEGMKAGTRADSSQRARLETMYATHFLARGRDYLRENNTTKAAESYTVLTRMDNKKWQARGHLSLGTLYTASGNAILQKAAGSASKATRDRAAAEFKKARARLTRAAALSPDDPHVQAAIARLEESTAPRE
jgi:Tfp pilus assembly protein PilF